MSAYADTRYAELVATVKTFQKCIAQLPDLVSFAEIAILLLIFYVAISFISLQTSLLFFRCHFLNSLVFSVALPVVSEFFPISMAFNSKPKQERK